MLDQTELLPPTTSKLTVFPGESGPFMPALADKAHKCGICHTLIGADATTTACPECGLLFHADCWEANWGCSAYGCSQVNALRPKDAAEESKTVEDAKEPFPWEYALLGGSVVAMIVGVLLFGVPSMLVAGAIGFMLIKGDPQRRRILALSGALAIIGLVAGIELSYFWWLGVMPFHFFGQ